MTAFLKRRWFLLSCTLLLGTCTVISADGQFKLRGHSVLSGVYEGYLYYTGKRSDVVVKTYLWFAIHAPKVGAEPKMNWSDSYVWIAIPVWLPLSAILGWLVIRELKWREKRAKATEAVP